MAARKKPTRLSPKRKRYARARAAGKTLAEAAKVAGYRGRRAAKSVTGAELERDPLVREEIERLVEAAMPTEQLLGLIADHASVDIAEFVTLVDDKQLAELAAEVRKRKKPGSEHLADRLDDIAQAGFFIDIPKAIRSGKSHLIHEIGFDKFGRPKLKSVDAAGAHKLLAQIKGLLRERVEHSGPGGGPIPISKIERVIIQAPRDA